MKIHNADILWNKYNIIIKLLWNKYNIVIKWGDERTNWYCNKFFISLNRSDIQRLYEKEFIIQRL